MTTRHLVIRNATVIDGSGAPRCSADIADAKTVGDAATFEKPIQAAPGIGTVIVNGEIAWRDGRSTGARPGRVLTKGPQ
jgi:N-acyl-D-aspartate/D-glutamate deacylase